MWSTTPSSGASTATPERRGTATLPATSKHAPSSRPAARGWPASLHHHHGCPPPAGHRRHHPASPPGDRRPHAPRQHRPAPGRPRRGAGLRHAAGMPCRPGDDPAMANHHDRRRAWRPAGHRAGPARPAPAAPPAGDHAAPPGDRAADRVLGGQRQARLAGLGFASVEGYLRVRRVEQGWSRRRMLTELQVGPAWLKGQRSRLRIP